MKRDFVARWPRRRLGRSGLAVPPLGLGGAGIGGLFGEVTDDDAVACVRFALERGLNFLDTDASYGESERRIGLALRGVPRDEYILSTKCGTHPDRRHDYSRDGVLWNVENSMRLLGTDRLDMVLVHDPPDMAPVLARGGALEALAELKGQKVIGAVGLGQRRHAFHAQAVAAGLVDVILTYKDYNPIRTTAGEYLLDLAARHDVGVLNGSPLVMGLLAGADPDRKATERQRQEEQREVAAARRLYQWCRDGKIEETSVALQFCLRERRIHSTIVGARNRAELEQNLRAACDPLPDTLWDDLAALHLTAGQQQPGEFCTLTEERAHHQ